MQDDKTHGVARDEKGQEQPVDKKRAQQVDTLEEKQKNEKAKRSENRRAGA